MWAFGIWFEMPLWLIFMTVLTLRICDWNHLYIRMYWNLLYLCVGLAFDHVCIWNLVWDTPIVNFHDGLDSQENILLWWSEHIFSWWCSHEILHFLWVIWMLTKFISWRWLPRNTIFSHDGDSHEIAQNTAMKILTQTWSHYHLHGGGRHELPH